MSEIAQPTAPPAPPALPPSVQIFQLLWGGPLGQAAYAVTKLGIPDLLEAGPRTAADLAAELSVQARGLERTLRSLTGCGITAESPPGTFALGPLGEALTSGHPTCARDVLLIQPWVLRAWEQLPAVLAAGGTGMQRAFGVSLFEYFAQRPEEGAIFDRAMTGINAGEPEAAAEALDLSDAGSLVDVGGGTGSLLAALLRANEHLHGVLFDVPAVVGRGAPALSGFSGRHDAVGGDFFEALPAGHDVYVLSHIVHDWDDDRAVAILRNCRTAMHEGSRLYLLEMLLNPDGDVMHPARQLDMAMLVLTGGAERTEAEYRDLLARAGLRTQRIIDTRSASSLVEAVPA